ncbi:DUF1800 family protein [Methylobacterium sp. J-070]|uniref:DUF1800 domain-containing protein n=1 Tax=Methylobacterium sp. J-070 TaxID=2836650 RepID=UPI001FB8831F|nr:DUF1800 domain-containing protein [Methylobacterium sp. J-070]MCJ2053850.1 DUF1800 domain-containing protein [Methylobacterium sp. J-070]
MIGDFHSARIASHRFGLGIRPNDLDVIGTDAFGRLKAELDAGVIVPQGMQTLTELVMHKFRWEQYLASTTHRPASQGATMAGMGAQPQTEAPLPEGVYRLPEGRFYDAEVEARLQILRESVIGFPERLVWFWSNHFAVGTAKSGWHRLTAGVFERDVVRPHALGRFADMLKASTRHFTMLTYLDNNNSVGPHSARARAARAAEGRGLNENLAREILELHTLGVHGGYNQHDVENFAKMLSGWTVGDIRQGQAAGSFVFDNAAHEPGPKTLLGRTYREAGVDEGLSALDQLAAAPATARFIAFKLARHFVSDNPPGTLVDNLARVFQQTGGDLRAVSYALISSPSAWGPMVKLRTPQEFLGAALRATQVSVPARTYTQFLRGLGNRIWDVPGPNGFADIEDAWSSPANLKGRFEVAAAVAEREKTGLNVGQLAESVVGDALSLDTSEAIKNSSNRQESVAVLLLSPEFQRR